MKKRSLLLAVPNILIVVALGLEFGLRCDRLLAYLAYPLACVVGMVAAVIGIVYGIRSGRKGTILAIACAMTIAAYALVPVIRDWRTSLEFTLNRSRYHEVVDLVRQGQIEAGSTQLADVDPAHEDLMPCTKQIAIEKSTRRLAIIFFTSNGIFGEFKGYMYVTDDQPPTIDQFRELRLLNPDQWTHIERVDTHWYYVIWDH